MSGRWYKRYGMDFIHGTFNLTLEEKGAYSLCLDLIYDRAGPIPDDARWLSGICGVSIRKWNCIRNSLIEAGKLVAKEGFLSNVRADEELVSSLFHAKKQAESGAKGGRSTAESRRTIKENSDLTTATLKPIEERRVEKNTLSLDNGASATSDIEFWKNAKTYIGGNNPGGVIGRWCKNYPKADVARAISAAQIERAVDPIPYIERILRGAKARAEVSLC